ncbi:DUF1345 domain-containing protein [Chelatococcus sp. SYSU_G07232]|uniref:DUF1345 domain-containing protein n=1 Tax=Chelatococcus albus TaxID=3047466 RepID=A0ABT7AH06_9HYPH|nr:DUF1345 domain-containing protein [Chelatococcus sp. SYSU_G07232]MDJ1158644.1 DUF1345 domain-containing protein [Chelatococcus sp. SYSU_G07232]
MRFVDQLKARPRTLVALGVTVGLALALPASWTMASRLLVAWDAGAAVYLGLVAVLAVRSDIHAMRRRAAREDDGAAVVLLLTCLAAGASLGAIVLELSGLAAADAGGRAFRLALAVVTVLCSWFLLHTTFALHYAHEYYGEGADGQRGGLAFPRGQHEADYWDFLDFSFNLGAAAQTSDVVITSRAIRRVVLGHTILSFLFNTTMLALGINVAASLMSGGP